MSSPAVPGDPDRPDGPQLDNPGPGRTRLIIAGSVGLVLSLGLGTWFLLPRAAEDDPVIEPLPPGIEAAAEPKPCRLYFPGEGGRLYPEEHEMFLEGELAERVATIVGALLEGPRGTGLEPPLPGEVDVSVYLDAGVAYLDFTSPAERPPASGSLREMLTVYSLVDTVLENFVEVEGVVLLWNGRQRSTFAGHLDTTRPLGARRELIAEADETPADSWSIQEEMKEEE